MDNKFFDKSELEGKNRADLPKIASQIKHRFDSRRAYYQTAKNNHFQLEGWKTIHQHITKFEQEKYNPWHHKWRNIHNSGDPKHLINYFEEIVPDYENIESLIEDFISQIPQSAEIEAQKKSMLEKIEKDFDSLSSGALKEIKKGINDVLGLKAELKLEGNFGEKIGEELDSAVKIRNRFMTCFVGLVLSVPIFWIITIVFDPQLSSNGWNLIRTGFSIAIGVLSYFYYSQYKLYQLICLRYTHLRGFLGGGATFISTLINVEGGNNWDAQREVNQKIANLFLEMDDVFTLSKKRTHPVEKVSELLEQLAKLKTSTQDTTK